MRTLDEQAGIFWAYVSNPDTTKGTMKVGYNLSSATLSRILTDPNVISYLSRTRGISAEDIVQMKEAKEEAIKSNGKRAKGNFGRY